MRDIPSHSEQVFAHRLFQPGSAVDSPVNKFYLEELDETGGVALLCRSEMLLSDPPIAYQQKGTVELWFADDRLSAGNDLVENGDLSNDP